MKIHGKDGCLKPSESSINVVVSDNKFLEGTGVSDSLKGIEPGILQRMIDMLQTVNKLILTKCTLTVKMLGALLQKSAQYDRLLLLAHHLSQRVMGELIVYQ